MKNTVAPTFRSARADPALRGQRYMTPSTQSEAARAFFINLLGDSEPAQGGIRKHHAAASAAAFFLV